MLKRNQKTGIVEEWKNGKKVGAVYDWSDALIRDMAKKSKNKSSGGKKKSS